MAPLTPEERRAILTRAQALFNSGEYWLAHEALETVWRSIIRDGDAGAAEVWQGLIQAAAALLHQRRGNRHGVKVVGRSALAKLAGPSGRMSSSRRYDSRSSSRGRSRRTSIHRGSSSARVMENGRPMTDTVTNGYDVIIVGAGPAGLCAAMYAGRGMLRALTIERGA